MLFRVIPLLLLLIPLILQFIDDTSLIPYVLQVKEKYDSIFPMSSVNLSDGTISMILLVLTLFFNPEKEVIIIEEPEMYVHPSLYPFIAQFLEDAVKRGKQILISTHNPTFLNQFQVSNIITVKRDKNGVSYCETVNNNRLVQEFLRNELGLGDLMIDNLL